MSSVTATVGRAWRFNRLLTASTLLFILLIPLPLIGMLADPKVITGVNGWIKPLKFLLSAASYSGTLLWLLPHVRGRRFLVRSIANLSGLVLVVEIGLITMQVMRNTTSHFNFSTPFDTVVFNIMGSAIMLLALMNLVLAVLLVFQRSDNGIFAWALRLAVLTSFLGMIVAYFMTARPTPIQLAEQIPDAPLATIGAHSVGVADGGPGLPLLGWSTTGGDLRVPHFVGLHGLQALLILGWLLMLPAARRRWSQSQRQALVMIGGVGYMAWTGLLTWQALRAQPITAPDGQTWLAYGVLAGVMALATGAVLLGMAGKAGKGASDLPNVIGSTAK